MKLWAGLTSGAEQTAVETARAVAEAGGHGVFTFEGPSDPFLPLAQVAGSVDVALMTNVAIALPRNPMQLAHTAHDLQRMSAGRFTLGLGTQIRPVMERRYGVAWDRPLARMREMAGALRAIFASFNKGAPLSFEGTWHRHTLMTPTFTPPPSEHGPPDIVFGALGPKMTALAAEVADGLAVMPFSSARSLRENTVPAITDGLARRDPTLGELRVIGEAIVCCGRDDAEMESARAGTRWLLAFYGSTPAYVPTLASEGFADLQPELQQLSRSGRWDEMVDLVSDDLLEAVAVCGTPTEVATGLAERFDGLTDEVAWYTPYAADPDLLAAVVDAAD